MEGAEVVTQESGWKSLAGDLHSLVMRSASKTHVEDLVWQADLAGTDVAKALDAEIERRSKREFEESSPPAAALDRLRRVVEAGIPDIVRVRVDEY